MTVIHEPQEMVHWCVDEAHLGEACHWALCGVEGPELEDTLACEPTESMITCLDCIDRYDRISEWDRSRWYRARGLR